MRELEIYILRSFLRKHKTVCETIQAGAVTDCLIVALSQSETISSVLSILLLLIFVFLLIELSMLQKTMQISCGSRYRAGRALTASEFSALEVQIFRTVYVCVMLKRC